MKKRPFGLFLFEWKIWFVVFIDLEYLLSVCFFPNCYVVFTDFPSFRFYVYFHVLYSFLFFFDVAVRAYATRLTASYEVIIIYEVNNDEFITGSYQG